MSQQFENFTVPPGDAAAQDALNKFLRGHRILKVERLFESGIWHFCVEWQMGPEAERAHSSNSTKVDYKEVLDAPTFALFATLRELRKELSGKERVPAYAVFTNEQLAAIAKARCSQAADLRKIEGLGEGRLEKYGEAVLERIRKHAEQQSQTGADRGTGEPA